MLQLSKPGNANLLQDASRLYLALFLVQKCVSVEFWSDSPFKNTDYLNFTLLLFSTPKGILEVQFNNIGIYNLKIQFLLFLFLLSFLFFILSFLWFQFFFFFLKLPMFLFTYLSTPCLSIRILKNFQSKAWFSINPWLHHVKSRIITTYYMHCLEALSTLPLPIPRSWPSNRMTQPL